MRLCLSCAGMPGSLRRIRAVVLPIKKILLLIGLVGGLSAPQTPREYFYQDEGALVGVAIFQKIGAAGAGDAFGLVTAPPGDLAVIA